MILSLVKELISAATSVECAQSQVMDMVSSLVDEIITNVVDESRDAELSPYLRMRNQRVALIHAEFRQQFPDFERDVRNLRVAGRRRRMKAKVVGAGMVARRSSRLDKPRGLSSGAGVLVVPTSGYSNEDGQEEMEIGSDCETAVGGRGGEGCQEETGDGGQGDCQEETGAREGGYYLEENGTGGEGWSQEESGAGSVEGRQEEAGGQDLGKHGCPPCGLKFRDSYNLKRHVQFVHEARQEPVSCPRPWCEQNFDILAEMKEHLRGCLKVCSICLKTFDRLDKYAAHQRAHVRLARRMRD